MKKKTELKRQRKINGRRIVSGMCMGPAYLFYQKTFKQTDFPSTTDNTNREIETLKDAIAEVVRLLNHSRSISINDPKQNFAEVFDAQIALLEDEFLHEELISFIKENICSATYAIFVVLQQKREQLLERGDSYLKERAYDIHDVMTKLLNVITGEQPVHHLTEPSIIFADSLSPSDTVNFPRQKVLGFVTQTGGITSHTAIMSRALHIPYVISRESFPRLVGDGDDVLLDGYKGQIIINPDQNTKKEFRVSQKKLATAYSRLCKDAGLPAITTDGVTIEVMANVELIPEMEESLTLGAEGVGLLRTEAVFLEAARIPSEQDQIKIYRKFSEGMSGKPVIVRTIDAGGDKIIASESDLHEANPFLGWRAIRFCLDHPQIFKTQMRAILQANTKKNLKIMIPMISCFHEILETRRLLEETKNELRAEQLNFSDKIELGIMIETPSAAILADRFAAEVDFMSIGTNDLTQYTLAVDRNNSKIAHLFNDLHPAVLLLMQKTRQAGEKYGTRVGVCGELAGNPEAVAILIGLGFTSLSMSPSMIPIIKKIIRSLSAGECVRFSEKMLAANSAKEVKRKARKFLDERLHDYQGLI